MASLKFCSLIVLTSLCLRVKRLAALKSYLPFCVASIRSSSYVVVHIGSTTFACPWGVPPCCDYILHHFLCIVYWYYTQISVLIFVYVLH